MNAKSGEQILDVIGKNKKTLERLGVKRLGLFGSFAAGRGGPDSDLDFLVEFERKSFDSYMDLKFFLEETFERPVDLVCPEAIKPRLKRDILNATLYVQGL